MIKKMILAVVASVFLLLSMGVSAEPAVQVLDCKLNDGRTSDDAHALNAKWLKWAHATAGTDEITSSYVSAIVGDFGGFMWLDSYPSQAVWATIAEAGLGDDNAYKTNKRPFASSPVVLERSLVPFSPRAPRNLLQMRAHCPDGPRSFAVFPPMPVLRRADAVGNRSCVALPPASLQSCRSRFWSQRGSSRKTQLI